MNYFNKLPIRKPATILVILVDILIILRCVHYNVDLPPNVSNFLTFFSSTILLGYFGSSAYEATRIKNKVDNSNG